MKAILTATWTAALLATAIPAIAAQPNYETQSVKVDYSDLDLSGARGVSTLDHRVTGAIEQVCGAPAFELNDRLRQQACERSTESSAHKSIENAVTAAKQFPMTSRADTRTQGVAGTAISSSSEQRWIKRNAVPRH